MEASLTLRDKFTATLNKINSGLKNASSSMQDFKSKVSGPAQALQQLGNQAHSAMSKVGQAIKSGLSSALTPIQPMITRLLSLFGNFGNRVSSAFNGVKGVLSNAFSGLGNISGKIFTPILNAAKSLGSNLGSAFNQAKNSFKNFGNDIKNGFSGIGESTQKATSSVRGFVTAIGLMKVAGMAVNAVKSSIDGAISRFDTLNQFPKVMQSWGYSAEEAQASTNKLLSGIDGLPTTLNGITTNVQSLVTSGLSLGNATDVALSLNNALLANSASTETANSAMEQYTQMLAIGKVDQMAWNSLVRGAGKTIDTMAKEMLGATANQATLYSAMQDGTVTFDQFNAKLVELNNATGGLAEQALTGSEGVRTSMSIIRTAITNGVAGSITKIDELLVKLNGKTLAQNIASFKPVISNIFSIINTQLEKLPALFEKIKPYFNVLKEAFNDIKGPISEAVGAVKDSLAELTGSFGSEESVGGFKSFVTGITDAIKGLADFVKNNSDAIAKFISMLPKLAAAFVGFKIGKGVLSPLLNFTKGLTTIVGATAKLGGGLAKSLGSLFGFGGKAGGGGAKAMTSALAPVESMMDIMKGIVKKAAGLAAIFAIIKIIEEAAQAMQDINNKVSGDFSQIGPKLANMAIAIAGMGIFVRAAGEYASKNPVAAIAGLASIAAISLELMLAAEAMKQINDKVPSNIGDFFSKMVNMGLAIGGFSLLAAAVGAVMATGIGALVGGAGLLAIALVAGDLMLVAEAIQQVNDKVPDDFGAVKGKIDAIAQVIQQFTAANLGNLLDVFANAVGVINTAVVIEGINKFVDLANSLNTFATVEIPDGVKAKIVKIQNVLQAMDGTSFSELLGHLIQAADLFVVDEAINQLINISKKLARLSNVTVEAGDVKGKIAQIQDVIGALGDGEGIFSKLKSLVSSGIDTAQFATADLAVTQLLSIGQSLARFKGINFDPTEVNTKVERIKEVVEKLSDGSITALLGSMIKSAELGEVRGALTALYSLFDPINQIASSNVMPVIAGQKIKLIASLIEELGTANLVEYLGTMIKGAQLGEVKSALDAMNNLVEPINTLAKGTINSGMANGKIQLIGSVIQQLGTAGIGEWVGAAVKVNELGEVLNSIQVLGTIRDAINNFSSGEINTEGINGVIASIKNVARQLSDFPATANVSGLELMVGTIQSVISQMDALINVTSMAATSTNTLSATFQADLAGMASGASSSMLAIVSSATSGMNQFVAAISSGVALAIATARSGSSQIATAFNGLSPLLYSAGLFAMQGLTRGIQAGAASAVAAATSVANQVSAAVKSAMDIHSPSRVMMKLGGYVTEGLANGILNAQNLVAQASNTIGALAVPSNIGTIQANGEVNSTIRYDESELARMEASASQSVVIENCQVTPQVHIAYSSTGDTEADADALLEAMERKVAQWMDVAIN